MAIAAAVLLAGIWRTAIARVPRLQSPGIGWVVAAVAGAIAVRPLIAAPRPKPVVTEPVLQAAAWARQHTSSACIDYLTQDGYTAYWLHLAVFGNARASGRAMDDDTFEPKKALVRWILPGGLRTRLPTILARCRATSAMASTSSRVWIRRRRQTARVSRHTLPVSVSRPIEM